MMPFVQPSQSPAVTAPPKGEPRRIFTNTRKRRFLPLPSGEVAMPKGIDGEGDAGRPEAVPYIMFSLTIVKI